MNPWKMYYRPLVYFFLYINKNRKLFSMQMKSNLKLNKKSILNTFYLKLTVFTRWWRHGWPGAMVAAWMTLADGGGMADVGRWWLSCLGPLIFLLQNTYIIICVSYLLTLIVLDEGHSRSASGALNQISTLLLDMY